MPFESNGFLTSDSIPNFKFLGQNPLNPFSEGTTFFAKRKNVIFKEDVSNMNGKISVSLWLSNVDHDLIPRTRIKIVGRSNDNKAEDLIHYNVFNCTVYLNQSNGWGLLELEFDKPAEYTTLELQLKNKYTASETYSVSNILIRETGLDVGITNGKTSFLNNRLVE